MKANGKEIKVRGANKKYPELDDLDKLYEELQKQCIADLAKAKKVPPNSIRDRVYRHFPKHFPGWEEKIIFGRRPHKKSSKKKKVQ